MELHNNKYNDTLIKIFKKHYLNKIPSNKLLTNFKYEDSSINRYIKLIYTFSNLIIDKTKLICTVLKINRNKQILNYAYVYGLNEKKDINNIYILNSTSLVSKDGEYRHRLINYDILLKLQNNKIYNYFYKYLSKEFSNNEFELTFEIFNSIDDELLNKYSKKIKNSNILLNIYLMSWITEIYNIYTNNQEINLNESSNNILFSNKDIQIFTNYIKTNNKDIIELIDILTYYNFKLRLELGQKLIPFNYIELKDYKNIIHHQWKELLINKTTLNLLYNLNSPCFSLFSNWFLIVNSNKNLFDNDVIFDKLFYSDSIKEILNYLYLAKNNLINLNNEQNNDNKNTISTLIKKLKMIISSSENNLLMSNVSMCYLSEYSGKTIFDYFNKLISNNQIDNNIGNLMIDYELFKKYIFEIIYSLYCLNIKGIIHGDLHLNNITFNIQNYNNTQNNNNYIIYNINENNYVNLKNTYLFKHLGCFPCIIDFSRSYIFLKSINENIIEKEKNKVRNKFIKNEKKRIISELNKIFPNYIKNNYHKIKFLFKNTNFETLFTYFSAYDTFTFITNLLIFIKKISIHKNITVNEKIINLLNLISKKSYYYLEQIIIEDNYNSNIQHKFPNYLILEEFFKENNNMSITKNMNIVDIFSIYNIDTFYQLKELKTNLYNVIENNIDKISNLSKKDKEEILKHFIILKKKYTDELDIEKIINNEYYKVKSNLLVATETINTSSYNETTNSLSFNNI